MDPNLRNVLMLALNELAYAPTEAAHNLKLTALRIMCGIQVPEDDLAKLRQADSHLPADLTLMFPDDTDKIDAFWAYFSSNWIDGATAPREEWAFYVRIQNGDADIAKATNNVAEGGFARMSKGRVGEPKSHYLARYIVWLIQFTVIETMAPEVLRSRGW